MASILLRVPKLNFDVHDQYYNIIGKTMHYENIMNFRK